MQDNNLRSPAPASAGERRSAYLIDLVLTGLAAYFLEFLLLFSQRNSANPNEFSWDALHLSIGLLVAAGVGDVIFFGISILPKSRGRGQSIGERRAGIALRDVNDGGYPSVWKSFAWSCVQCPWIVLGPVPGANVAAVLYSILSVATLAGTRFFLPDRLLGLEMVQVGDQFGREDQIW